MEGTYYPLELFLQKPPFNEGYGGRNLKRAVDIPSESILFNIDQKADVISKDELDALIAVFMKVFDEHCMPLRTYTHSSSVSSIPMANLIALRCFREAGRADGKLVDNAPSAWRKRLIRPTPSHGYPSQGYSR